MLEIHQLELFRICTLRFEYWSSRGTFLHTFVIWYRANFYLVEEADSEHAARYMNLRTWKRHGILPYMKASLALLALNIP